MRPTLIGISFFGLCLILLVFSTLPVAEPLVQDKSVAYRTADPVRVEARMNRSNARELVGNMLGLIVSEQDSLSSATFTRLLEEVPFTNIHFDLPDGPLLDSLLTITRTYQGTTPLFVSQALQLEGPHWSLSPDILLTLEDSLLLELARYTGRSAREAGIGMLRIDDLEEVMTGSNRLPYVTRLHQFQLELESEGVLTGFGPIRPYYPLVRDTVVRDSLLAPLKTLGRGGLAGLWVDSLTLEGIHLNSRREQIVRRYVSRHASFQGLLMGAVQAVSSANLAEQVRKMFKAGIDIYYARPDELRKVYAHLMDLQIRSALSQEILLAKNEDLLMARYWALQDSFESAPLDPVFPYQLARAGLTLLRKEGGKLPLGALDGDSIRVWISGAPIPYFSSRMQRYGPVSFRYLKAEQDQEHKDWPDLWVWNGEEPSLTEIDELMNAGAKTGIIHFGPLHQIAALDSSFEVLHHYGASAYAQDLMAQAIWGGVSPGGKAPFSWGTQIAFGDQVSYPKNRVGFAVPELVGMDPTVLDRIDTIVNAGIADFAMPGAQVLVARKGQVIYDRNFGYQTYEERKAIAATGLYDIASVTKVAATTLGAMLAYDQGDMRLDQPVGDFFGDPYYRESAIDIRDTLWLEADSLALRSPDFIHQAAQRNGVLEADTVVNGDSVQLIRHYQRSARRIRSQVFNLKLGELMTHTSGLPAGLPILGYMYYRDSLTGKYDRFYAPSADTQHSVPVAARMYLRADYGDSLWQAIKALRLDPEKRYMYSDANMILVQRALDSLHQEPLDQYLDRTLYGPLGMSRTLFRPLERFSAKEIAPTEHDTGWRGQVLRGYVHDPTAALMGGVAGNAGLFSNTTDLAHLFQMLLNQGHYGGKRYLRPATVRRFTQVQAGHRGYGFDKPPREGAYIIGQMASPDSYGHTGFTGTCVWVDPQQELIFIFLSNRVHPNARNWKLNSLEIRQRVHDAVYASIGTEIAKTD